MLEQELRELVRREGVSVSFQQRKQSDFRYINLYLRGDDPSKPGKKKVYGLYLAKIQGLETLTETEVLEKINLLRERATFPSSN